ncbi:hypothetical protein HK100_003323 [Physocladia obscura]|uniref:Uncharacterized protein n=1 Tax=Physocladia obscura TaxID=109957 RepID=A0AAD5T9J8_9FUNG|nr:hypothetical protein HK100_003323 [Physocladia obscura]
MGKESTTIEIRRGFSIRQQNTTEGTEGIPFTCSFDIVVPKECYFDTSDGWNIHNGFKFHVAPWPCIIAKKITLISRNTRLSGSNEGNLCSGFSVRVGDKLWGSHTCMRLFCPLLPPVITSVMDTMPPLHHIAGDALQRDKDYKAGLAEKTRMFGADSREVEAFVAENHPTTGNLVALAIDRQCFEEIPILLEQLESGEIRQDEFDVQFASKTKGSMNFLKSWSEEGRKYRSDAVHASRDKSVTEQQDIRIIVPHVASLQNIKAKLKNLIANFTLSSLNSSNCIYMDTEPIEAGGSGHGHKEDSLLGLQVQENQQN